MNCEKCGKPLLDDSVFCIYCGEKTEASFSSQPYRRRRPSSSDNLNYREQSESQMSNSTRRRNDWTGDGFPNKHISTHLESLDDLEAPINRPKWLSKAKEFRHQDIRLPIADKWKVYDPGKRETSKSRSQYHWLRSPSLP